MRERLADMLTGLTSREQSRRATQAAPVHLGPLEGLDRPQPDDWAVIDPALVGWLVPELDRLHLDPRKSVAKRLAELTD